MAKQSPFDPDAVDPEAYSRDPHQHGTSDFGKPSEGVGTNSFHDSTSGIDMDKENIEMTKADRETQPQADETDLPTGKIMSDEAAEKLIEIPENPSDEALFRRADATYLEPEDDPTKGYDPHNQGYDNRPGK